MKVRVIDAMWACRKEIADKALKARCISRVNRIEMAVEKYQRTLDPHDFCPSMGDVSRIPDIRKAIIDGTDEEFNECIEEVTAKLPRLTFKFLKERNAILSALLPFKGRSADVLSLATVWFTCGLCHVPLMHGTDALMHQCRGPRSRPPVEPIGEATFENWVLSRGWRAGASGFRFSTVASTIARGLILDCGEDPENITVAEINSKFHRFVFSEKGGLAVHGWRGAVSTGVVGIHWHGLTVCRILPSSITNFATPPGSIGSSDRANAQNLCMILTHITRRNCGVVSIVGGIVDHRFCGSVTRHSPQSSDTTQRSECLTN